MDAKLHNILSFTTIFLSGDLNPLYQSPSYILEKFHLYFGDVEIKKHKEIDFFKKYKKIWKNSDYRINSIFLFLFNVVNFYNYNRNKEIDPFGEEDWNELDNIDNKNIKNIENIARNPDEYYYLFDMWIGDVNNIPDIKKGGLHYILKRDMFDVYKDYFKELL